MNADEYQKLAARTLIDAPDNEYTNEEIVLVLNALRVAGEAAAIANTVKKAVFHRHDLDRGKLRDDLLSLIDSVSNLETPDQAPRMDDEQIMVLWNALGLVGEAGELAPLVRHAIWTDMKFDRDGIVDEAGDTLWYVAALCTKLDIPMSEIMERNIQKLKARYPDGYSSEHSKSRAEYQSVASVAETDDLPVGTKGDFRQILDFLQAEGGEY